MQFILRIWRKIACLIFLSILALGFYDYRFSIVAIICMVAPILIAIAGKGRYWCGHLCPRGSFYEEIISKLSPNNRFPRLLKSLPIRLLVMFIMFTVFGLGLAKNWGYLTGVGFVFYKIIAITTLIGVVLALLFHKRAWCNICPMGTIAALITQVKQYNGKLTVGLSCNHCQQCEKACPMHIRAFGYKGGTIDSSDCIHCHTCVHTCPRHSIKSKKS